MGQVHYLPRCKNPNTFTVYTTDEPVVRVEQAPVDYPISHWDEDQEYADEMMRFAGGWWGIFIMFLVAVFIGFALAMGKL